MGRILALDYGIKRCGLAVTDILGISINPLPTQATKELPTYLLQYLREEEVTTLVIGDPIHKDGTATHLRKHIDKFVEQLRKRHVKPLEIEFVDEAHSSSEAKLMAVELGIKKSKRRDKALVDQLSAMLILRRFLNL